LTLFIVEAHELGQEALCMNPAQGMGQNVELTRIVADDGQLGIDTMVPAQRPATLLQ